MEKQISREQANRLMPKESVPHETRFKMKDIRKELNFKFANNGKANVNYSRMEPKNIDHSQEVLTRKDVEGGKLNQQKLYYDYKYDVSSLELEQKRNYIIKNIFS